MNSLTRRIEDKSGKIRNTAAIKTNLISKTKPYLESVPQPAELVGGRHTLMAENCFEARK
jgi:hypothetical protein